MFIDRFIMCNFILKKFLEDICLSCCEKCVKSLDYSGVEIVKIIKVFEKVFYCVKVILFFYKLLFFRINFYMV